MENRVPIVKNSVAMAGRGRPVGGAVMENRGVDVENSVTPDGPLLASRRQSYPGDRAGNQGLAERPLSLIMTLSALRIAHPQRRQFLPCERCIGG